LCVNCVSYFDPEIDPPSDNLAHRNKICETLSK